MYIESNIDEIILNGVLNQRIFIADYDIDDRNERNVYGKCKRKRFIDILSRLKNKDSHIILAIGLELQKNVQCLQWYHSFLKRSVNIINDYFLNNKYFVKAELKILIDDDYVNDIPKNIKVFEDGYYYGNDEQLYIKINLDFHIIFYWTKLNRMENRNVYGIMIIEEK